MSSVAGSDGMPQWLRSVRPTLDADLPEWFERFPPPPNPARRSAVLLTFGATPGRDVGELGDGQEVVLTERSSTLRAHAGQVSFPGGKIDPEDVDEVGAALREAQEEVGIDPAAVTVVDTLPALYLHPSQNAVTPVLGWWHEPHDIGVVDPGEVARVVRVPLEEVLDQANRFTVTAPRGYRGPGFELHGLFVWGFTAQLLSTVLDLGGLTRPWDQDRERRLPLRMLRPYLRRG